jgi:predicted RNA-binding Zn ribbon-like protein
MIDRPNPARIVRRILLDRPSYVFAMLFHTLNAVMSYPRYDPYRSSRYQNRCTGVKVVFAHDTEVALHAAAALVNTAHGEEQIPTIRALDAFVDGWEWTGTRAHDRAELAEVQALRPRLEQLWTVSEDDAARLVNGLLRESNALPQLVKHGHWDYHLHATSSAAPFAERMAVEAAMAVVDVIRMKELDRLRICAADDCQDVLVDLSKNHSRRFCGTTCANRTHVAAYRARRSG